MENKIRLAKHILTAEFGELTGTIGAFLLCREDVPLPFILKASVKEGTVPPSLVRAAILILVQHNVVTFRLFVDPKTQRSSFMYTGQLERVLDRLFYPKYLQLAKALFDETGFEIAKMILTLGRCTLPQIVEQLNTSSTKKQEQITKTFNILVTRNYLIECMVPKESLLAPSNEEMETTNWYQVNSVQFQREIRNEAFIELVKQKISPSAGVVMTQILKELDSQNQKNFAVWKLTELCKGLIDERYSIYEYMSIMSQPSSRLVRRVDDAGGGTYELDIPGVIHLLHKEIIESVVLEAHGRNARRIFNLLSQNSPMEQKQIQQHALLPMKETREKLYELLKHNLLQLQEIPQTNERAPSKTFYLWQVNMLQVIESITNRCCQMIVNMRERRAHEKMETDYLLKGRAEYLNLDELDESAAPSNVLEVKRVCDVLEAHEMRLSETLCRLLWTQFPLYQGVITNVTLKVGSE